MVSHFLSGFFYGESFFDKEMNFGHTYQVILWVEFPEFSAAPTDESVAVYVEWTWVFADKGRAQLGGYLRVGQAEIGRHAAVAEAAGSMVVGGHP